MTDESMSGSRGWNIPRKKSNRFRNWAIVAALVGLLFASDIGAVAYVVSLISVIGIPLAFVIVAIPTICLLIVLAYAVFRLTGLKGLTGQILAFVAAAGILVVYPPVHNAEINLRVASLIGDDVSAPRGAGALVSPAQTLGLMRRSGDRGICRETCVYLLIRQQVAAVAIAKLDKRAAVPGFDEPAKIFRLVQQSPCEMRDVRVNSIHAKSREAGTITDMFLDLVDRGYCISTEDGVISQADRIVMVANTRYFPEVRTISPVASTIKASRAGLYAKTTSGSFATLHQDTPVTYSLLGPVLAHTFDGGSGLSVKASWWREWHRTERRTPEERDYLRETVGLIFPENLK